MRAEVPFEVMEAMLAATNKAIYSGWTTHQVICASLQAANGFRWVLKQEPGGRNANVDAALGDAKESSTPHVLIELEELTEGLFQKKSKR